MKLRIKDHSLRFRVAQSELVRLVDSGRIEETIYFTSDGDASLTYALEHRPSSESATMRYQTSKITVVLSTAEVSTWQKSEQVGIYSTLDLGARGSLEILVEKDYACLDLSDSENVDTFPNPNVCTVL